MTGRAFQYCLVGSVTILFGIGFSRECARCAEAPKPGLIHPAMSLMRVGGELVEPPRLAFHPGDAPRVLSGQHEAATQTLRRASGPRKGAAVARQGIALSPWLLAAGAALVFGALIMRCQA